MEWKPGALVAGRYRVERKVGSGGMGEVWAGEHVAIGLKVALKTLLPAAACDRELVARFRREAYLLGRIRSDYVAKVIDFVTDERYGLVLVMEFVEGEALGALLEGRRLSVEETIDLGVDLASALCDLHRAQVVHRDLKPDNIILEPLLDRRRAMIVDFGVGRMTAGGGAEQEEEITGITRADMAVGTIAYMAPEQLLSSRDVTSVSDVYALGAILFRAASGQQVFGGVEDADYAKKKLFSEAERLPLTRFDRVARGLQGIVGRALMRRPEGRFAGAREMLDELVELTGLVQMTALDLDAATEVAPLSSELGLEGLRSPTSATLASPRLELRSSPSPGPQPIVDDEPTLDATQLPRPPMPSVDRYPPGPVDRPPLPSLPEPPPSSRFFPEPAPAPPGIERSVALAALAAALAGGLILGFLAHRSLAGEPAPRECPPALASPRP